MQLSSWLSELSRTARIGLIISLCWIVVVFTVSFDEASESYSKFDMSSFLGGFMIIGVLPVVIGWGVRWVKKN